MLLLQDAVISWMLMSPLQVMVSTSPSMQHLNSSSQVSFPWNFLHSIFVKKTTLEILCLHYSSTEIVESNAIFKLNLLQGLLHVYTHTHTHTHTHTPINMQNPIYGNTMVIFQLFGLMRSNIFKILTVFSSVLVYTTH